MRIAGIELGGTKSIILLWKDGEVTQRNTFPTTSPAETLGRLHRQLAHWNGETVLDALGIASFGPFALDRASPSLDGKSVVEGKSLSVRVVLGCRLRFKKKTKELTIQ